MIIIIIIISFCCSYRRCGQVDSKKGKIPAPVCGYSSTVKQATSAMDLRYNPEKGRHMVVRF